MVYMEKNWDISHFSKKDWSRIMKTKVLIIGAGPYGIALADYLDHHNVDFVICGVPFELWFNHTLDSMSIRSDRLASQIFSEKREYDLTQFIFNHYPRNAREIIKVRLDIHLFRKYLQSVLNRIKFPIIHEKVDHLEEQQNGFKARLSDGRRIEATHVVLASGIQNHRYMPEVFDRLESENIVHTYYVQQYSHWKNKKVLIVGTGQSAAEAVAHLADDNRIWWQQRKDPVFYSEPINLPKPIFNFFLNLSSQFFYLPGSMKRSLGKKFVETTITPDMQLCLSHKNVQVIHGDVNKMGLKIAGDEIIAEKNGFVFDGIVSATGYRYQVRTIGYLSKALIQKLDTIDGKIPHLNRVFQTSVKNLFMIGGITEPVFGPSQRFMIGNQFAAKTVGKYLCRYA